MTENSIHTPEWSDQTCFPLDLWMKRHMQLEDTVPMTHERIVHWQMDKLRQTLLHARDNSPFYRKKLSGIAIDNLQMPKDLSLLPCTTAEDLRQSPESLLCLSQDEIARVVTLASSGSTGTPKRLFFTQEDLDRTVDFFHFGMSALTKSGESVLALLPNERPDSVGRLLLEGLNRLGATTFVQSNAQDIPNALQLLISSHASCIVGTPIHLLALAKEWRAAGLPLYQKNSTINNAPLDTPAKVSSVLCCWDVAPPQLVSFLQETWGCTVQHHWGMTETGLGGAVECSNMEGMHIREADVFVEILDPETLEALPDGEVGEIVVSTLSRKGMPLIRYRTGDSARILQGECPCKSPLRRLSLPRRIEEKNIPQLLSPEEENIPPVTLAEIDDYLLSNPLILEHHCFWNEMTNTLAVNLDVLCPSRTKITEQQTKALCLTYADHALHDLFHDNISVELGIAKSDGTVSTGFAKRVIGDAK